MRTLARTVPRAIAGTSALSFRVRPCLHPCHLFAFALGVAVLQRLPALPDAGMCLFLMAASGFLLCRYPRHGILPAFIFGIMFAAWTAGAVLSQRLALVESGSRGEITAEITDLPQRSQDQWQFEAKILGSTDFPALTGRRVKLAWYRTDAVLVPGNIHRFEVTLRTPNGVYNPGGFDAEKRALQKRWAAQGYVRHAISADGHRVTIDRIRDALSGQIRRQIGDTKARFVSALALGDTRLLEDADWEILRRTGITHLIAISGFHVGIVALSAAWLAFGFYRILPGLGLHLPQPKAAAWAAIAASWAYTAFAGFALPTVRTALMIAVFMGCRLLARRCTVIHAVALSMAAMLLWDPLSILAPGFWLSFGGVILLVAFMPRQSGSGIFQPFLRAQWVASLGLLPLSLGFFGQTTLVGPLVNLLAIPWISLVVVPLALLGCLFAGIPPIAEGCWNAAAALMQWLWMLLQWLQALPWSSRILPEAGLPALLLAMLGVCLFLLPRQIPGRRFGPLLMLPMLFPGTDQIPEGQLRVAMMDVGQGTSVLVRTRHHALLYDAGPGIPGGFSRGETTVLPALRALNVRRLHRVVISHGDNDHAGGLAALRSGIAIDRIDASWQALPKQVPHRECLAGSHWQWDGVEFTYLWPVSGFDGEDNDRSCVLSIKSGQRRILLAGDISSAAEARLLERYGHELEAEVILVPHHGSAGSSSDPFIAAVRPRIALVSSGFQNRFRHPRREVIARYDSHGAVTVNTVETGWAELAGTPTGWEWARRSRFDDRRYWLRPAPEPAVTGY